MLYDGVGKDTLTANARDAYMNGAGYRNEAHGFGQVTANSVLGGADIIDVRVTDYLFRLIGQGE